jgi:hypothetical protein
MPLDPDTANAIADAIDDATISVWRPLSAALARLPADVWRNPDAVSGRRQAPVLHHADIRVRLIKPSAKSLQLLADLGALKADRISHAAWNEDVLEGDELHIAGVVYQVERVARSADKTLLAVWQTSTPADPSSAPSHFLQDDQGQTIEDE